MESADDRYGVLLFDRGWDILGETLKHYEHNGPIGRYLYCRRFELDGAFAELTFTPSQVDGRITDEMTVWIPIEFIKFVATSTEGNARHIGFEE